MIVGAKISYCQGDNVWLPRLPSCRITKCIMPMIIGSTGDLPTSLKYKESLEVSVYLSTSFYNSHIAITHIQMSTFSTHISYSENLFKLCV